jgi:glycopeptide antibiotics resistance protein
MHCTGYFVAAFSISFAFPLRSLYWRAIFLIIFSIGIEIAQHQMPPRSFDIFDIFANSSGTLIGLGVLVLLLQHVHFVRQIMFWGHKI